MKKLNKNHNSELKKRINKKLENNQTRKQKKQEILYKRLRSDPNGKLYKKAFRKLVLKYNRKNILGLLKWFVIDLVCLFPFYLSYSWYQQLLNNTLLSPRINSQTLWGVQQQLLLSSIITGSLLILGGFVIIKRGLYHRPYNNEYLKDTIHKIRNDKDR